MSRENGEEDGDDQVKVHEIKFDEFGIMDDGLDDTTHQKLNSAEPEGTQIYFKKTNFIFIYSLPHLRYLKFVFRC